MSLIGEVSAREELARRDGIAAQKNAFNAGGLAATKQQELRDAARIDGYKNAILQGVNPLDLVVNNYKDTDAIQNARGLAAQQVEQEMADYVTARPQ